MDPLLASILSDSSLLEFENMTPEDWRLFLTSKLTKQKDAFISAFKSQVIDDITSCMASCKSNISISNLHQNIVNKVNESQFEAQYQNFADGIVGTTFEYVCQMIIRNSLDNIKRTQSALNSFSSTHNMNDVALQPYCDEGVNGHGSYFGINSSITTFGAENSVNSNVNKIDALSIQNSKSLNEKNSSALQDNISSDINIKSNYEHVHTIHCLETVEENNDLKTNQSLMSLDMDINDQDTNFKFSDDFEEESMSYSVNESTDNEMNFDILSKPKCEKETICKISKSLKILEDLVNDKAPQLKDQEFNVTEIEVVDPEVGKSEITKPKVVETEVTEPEVIEPESQDLNVETIEKKDRNKSKQKNSRKNNHDKSEERAHNSLEENKNEKKKRFIEKKKISTKKKTSKNNVGKLKDDKFSGVKTGQNISFSTNDPSVSRSNYQSETELLTPKNSKLLGTTKTSDITLTLKNSKDSLSFNKLKSTPSDVENTLSIVKDNSTSTNSSNSSIVLTKSSIGKDADIVKNKSAFSSSFSQKLLNKKMYEKDRKSLFSPDIILKLPPKNSETGSQKNRTTTKNNSKISSSITEINHQVSTKKRKASLIKKTVSNKNSQSKAKSNRTSSSTNKKRSVAVNGRRKFKKLKIEFDDEKKVNKLDTNVIKEKKRNDVLESNKSTIDDNSNDQVIQRLLKKYASYNLKTVYVVIDPNKIYL